jgi:hypothetical protein
VATDICLTILTFPFLCANVATAEAFKTNTFFPQKEWLIIKTNWVKLLYIDAIHGVTYSNYGANYSNDSIMK